MTLIGRPNVGKSSIINGILREEQLIVSNIAGTTRDSVDLPFTFRNKKYTLIDTAGIRKKAKVDSDLEYYSVVRSIKAMKRTDIVALVIDYKDGIMEQDKKIIGIAYEEQKPIMLVVNKFDNGNEIQKKRFSEQLREELKFLYFAPIVYVSALKRKNLNEILTKAAEVYEQYVKNISVGTLNGLLRELVIAQPHPSRNGRNVSLSFITQTRIKPPVFTLFSNFPELVHFSYLRYLENNFRKVFGFEGVPIKFDIRKK